MKIFLDSANPDEVRAVIAQYAIDGVTMNPGLLAREKVRLASVLPLICELVPGPVSAPVRATEADAIVAEGRAFAEQSERILVKIPIHAAGLKAMAKLHAEGIRTHATVCCSANQALLAARAGADYVSPLVGRLEETGVSGMDLVAQIIEIYDHYDYDTQIMVASLRTTTHVQEAALLGVDAVTLSRRLLEDLAQHPLADRVNEEFLAAWKRI